MSSFFDRQPVAWEQRCLDSLFTKVVTPAANTDNMIQAMAGDVVMWLSSSPKFVVHARVVSEDESCSQRYLVLRSKGSVDPEFFVHWVGVRAVQHLLQHKSSNVLLRADWKEWRTLEMAVPDLPTQQTLLQSVAMSAGWLKNYTKMLSKQSELLENMAEAVTTEILQGSLTPQEAVLHVTRAAVPELLLGKRTEEHLALTGGQAARWHDREELFVPLSDHQRIVNGLRHQQARDLMLASGGGDELPPPRDSTPKPTKL